MNLYEAIVHSFSTAGTGGFGIKNDSIASYSTYSYGKYLFVKLHNNAKDVLGKYYDEIEFNAMVLSKGWTNLGELENIYHNYMEITCHKYGIEYNREA